MAANRCRYIDVGHVRKQLHMSHPCTAQDETPIQGSCTAMEI